MAGKKRILWVSRHVPLPAQVDALEAVFGPVEIVQDPRPFDSADDIVERFRSGGYDEIVVVAPLSVIARLLERGVRPLWAEMEHIPRPDRPDPRRDVEAAGRWYRFKRFRRIVRIEILYEEL